MAGLDIQPETLGGAEVPGQAQCSVGRHGALAEDDFVDPPGRHADILGQLVLADLQRLQELLEKNLTGRGGW
jgi:hypothetical protein